MDFAKIKQLVELVNSTGIAEIEIREGVQTIRVRGAIEASPQAPPNIVNQPLAALPDRSTAETADKTEEETASAKEYAGISVKAPMVGTLYNSSAPGEKPFVASGQKVKKGDTLCIVEAMKTMNEIPAPKNGVITEILVSNGMGVEYGQTLMILDDS